MDIYNLNKLCYKVIGSAIEVHKKMGPGLFESIYEECLMEEFALQGIKAERQVELQLEYKGRELQNKFFIDILVENEIVIELKAIKELNDVHYAQILSYLKLSDKTLGLLINFHVPVLKNGIKRVANGLPIGLFPTNYEPH